MVFSEIVVQSVVSPAFLDNTYLIHLAGNQECVVIDPGMNPEQILRALETSELRPVAVLITHAHLDHIYALPKLKEAFPDCKIYVGEHEKEKLTDPNKNLAAFFRFSVTIPPADHLLRHGEHLFLAGMEFEVRHTPGHSHGHVIFVIPSEPTMVLLSGDVLFRGGVGRTDFPDGSWEELNQSIKEQIWSLPDDTVVYPGHSESTTVGREKQNAVLGV